MGTHCIAHQRYLGTHCIWQYQMYHSLGTHCNAASKVFGHPRTALPLLKGIWAPTALSVASSKAFGHSLHCCIRSIWAPTALLHQKHLGTHCIVASKARGAPTALSHQKPEGHPLHCRIKSHSGTHCHRSCLCGSLGGTHCIVASKARGAPTVHCRIKSYGHIWTPTASVVASKATVFGHPLRHCRIKSIWAPTAFSSASRPAGRDSVIERTEYSVIESLKKKKEKKLDTHREE